MPPYLPSLEGHLAGDGLPLVALVGQWVASIIGQLGEAHSLDDHCQGRGQEFDPIDGPEDAKALHLVRSPRGHQGTTAVLRHRRRRRRSQEGPGVAPV